MNVDLFQFLLVSRYVARDVEPVKIARGCNLTFVSSRFVSFLSPAVYLSSSLSFFYLSRPHSHSNLFERIIHARVMLEMHSREEGSAAIHRVRHSLYFIFCYLLFFFLAIIRRTAGAHIFLVERQSDANRNCTLDISAIGTGFQIFVQVHVRTRCKLGNGALVIDTFHY